MKELSDPKTAFHLHIPESGWEHVFEVPIIPLHAPQFRPMAWPAVHHLCHLSNFINLANSVLLKNSVLVLFVWRILWVLLREDTHQAACHISCCLGLEWLQDDIITEPVQIVDDQLCRNYPVPSGNPQVRVAQRCLGCCALYNLLFALPPSGCITNLAEIQEELYNRSGHVTAKL